ncbi:hypothetical protein ACFUIY_09395 [Streptomyces griseorubiginosus]|uniref:hypothetical protein n=1 Tax=Streptomyces griseorubiginosus TaxID=67304 RepID=UPI0015E86B2F|nr:hypothetical protein [Streptomyces griseorubiginosus]
MGRADRGRTHLGQQTVQPPVVGRLDLSYEALSLPGDPDQILFVCSGKTVDDLGKLRILASCYARSTPRLATAGQDTAQSQRDRAGEQDSRHA